MLCKYIFTFHMGRKSFDRGMGVMFEGQSCQELDTDDRESKQSAMRANIKGIVLDVIEVQERTEHHMT